MYAYIYIYFIFEFRETLLSKLVPPLTLVVYIVLTQHHINTITSEIRLYFEYYILPLLFQTMEFNVYIYYAVNATLE